VYEPPWRNKKCIRTSLLAAGAVLGMAPLVMAGAASAQTVGSVQQRDIDQQQRIEQGLKSGQLSTGEAARLDRPKRPASRTPRTGKAPRSIATSTMA